MRGGNIIGHVQSNKEGKTKHLEGSDFNPVDNNFESSKEVLNRYVVIQYNGKPYPSFVVNIDEQDVRVENLKNATYIGRDVLPMRVYTTWKM